MNPLKSGMILAGMMAMAATPEAASAKGANHTSNNFDPQYAKKKRMLKIQKTSRKRNR